MVTEGGRVSASPWKVWGALAIVYVVWGSTYLAIRYSLETLPPFLMAGARFLAAGALMYAWGRARGAPRPEVAHWRTGLVVGGLLLLCGNGGVVWAQQRVPSGVAAVLVATMPLWMALIPWFTPGGTRPEGRTLLGLGAGLGGVALLVGAGRGDGPSVDPVGAVVLLGASLAWASGSLYSRRAPVPESPALSTALPMLAGGAFLTVAGTLAGEWAGFRPEAASARSWLALVYLMTFGSIVGFSAYVWLLRATTPERVSTYAYVNPVVAMVLGWGLAGESLTPPGLVGAAVIVGSVALIVGKRSPAPAPTRPAEPALPPPRPARVA